MIIRDKNHPSIIMWSLANGPKDKARGAIKEKDIAYEMFAKYINSARELDPTRLVTFMGDDGGLFEWFGLADVICINRFNGWSKSNGLISEGVKNVSAELDELYLKFNKPCILNSIWRK